MCVIFLENLVLTSAICLVALAVLVARQFFRVNFSFALTMVAISGHCLRGSSIGIGIHVHKT